MSFSQTCVDYMPASGDRHRVQWMYRLEFKKRCAKLGAPVAPLRMNPRVVRWFTPGLHVKRWLVLLILGMVIISLGIGYALRNVYSSGFRFPGVTFYLTLQFLPYVARAALFGALGL